ncbi:MAG: EamA family transporter, partial [Proteobacteria bacterium]
MTNFFLYAICTLIWGSTWLVITYQLEGASPVVSVFYRFLLSSTILLVICGAFRLPLRFTWNEHRWFIAQGIFMFSVNYMLTYIAEGMVSSGLVAITFTFLLYY